jgi:release factor glutamine methyltransferase
MTVLEALNWATDFLKDHQVDNPRLSAELLLSRSMGVRREELYIRLHSQITEGDRGALNAFVQRRVSGEPLQYILGQQEFWSFDMKVAPQVLIPRPETELLVEQALSILESASFGKAPRVLELGTGSGAIAISLAREVKEIFVVATDVSKEALELARQNALHAGVERRITFVHGDLFNALQSAEEKGPFDVIVSNPPYVPRPDIESLAKEVKNEPRIALDGGEDGLDFHRRIISEAPAHLRAGGWLLLEMGQGQGARVSALIGEKVDFQRPQIHSDLSGIERVIKVQKKTNVDSRT